MIEKPICKIKLEHISGIPNIPETGEVEVILWSKQVDFNQTDTVMGQKYEELGEAFVMYDQLISGGFVTNLDARMTNLNESIGTLLFGMRGAVAGAILDRNDKKVMVERYVVFNYKSSEDGSEKSIYFKEPLRQEKCRNFMASLKSRLPGFIDLNTVRRQPIQL